MTRGVYPPISSEGVAQVDQMLKACIEAHIEVASNLKVGMTEYETLQVLLEAVKGRGVTDFWYDIPIVVLFGVDRFLQLTDPDYAVKQPSQEVRLKEGDSLFFDMHPRHESGQWGNFAATGLFRPRDDEAVRMMETVQTIQRQGIKRLSLDMTGQEVESWFSDQFEKEQIELLDVRNNVGHSMGQGAKSDYDRLFLDADNTTPIGGGIYGIEPGGMRRASDGRIVIARSEDSVHISEDDGKVTILGWDEPVPVVFE